MEVVMKQFVAKFGMDMNDRLLYAKPDELRALADLLEQGESAIPVGIFDPACDDAFVEGECSLLVDDEWKEYEEGEEEEPYEHN
jgi:hypothetical protein